MGPRRRAELGSRSFAPSSRAPSRCGSSRICGERWSAVRGSRRRCGGPSLWRLGMSSRTAGSDALYPEGSAACAGLDLARVERTLAKHYEYIPAPARELGVSGPDLRRLTWSKPELLEEAMLECLQRRSAASGMGGGQGHVKLDRAGSSLIPGEALTARPGLRSSDKAGDSADFCRSTMGWCE